MIKAIYVHLFVGIILTYLLTVVEMMGPVVLGGGLNNLTIIDVIC